MVKTSRMINEESKEERGRREQLSRGEEIPVMMIERIKTRGRIITREIQRSTNNLLATTILLLDSCEIRLL